MPPFPSIAQALAAALNSEPAQRLTNEHYASRPQDFFHTAKSGVWQSASTTFISHSEVTKATINPKSLRLISWNIDVLVGFAEERMSAALQYLESLVTSSPPDVPIVIFLQEMGQSDLEQIRNSTWIKQRFYITDLEHTYWLSPHYGTTTLIDNRLSIKSVFRVPFVSKFQRDGLFVDIALNKSASILRLCNVHLESLVADPPVRPIQVADAAVYLQNPEVAAALLAGDLNAIQPFDRDLHSKNGLKDTYLELGGEEDSDDGYTWGYQVSQLMRHRFGCSRMDKILTRGEVKPVAFERIGMGVKVAEEVRREVEQEIEGGWVTDHYGVMGDFEISGGIELASASTGQSGELKPKLS